MHAAVVLKAGRSATGDELCDFVSGRLAEWKMPASITLVADVPIGPAGKIQRRLLRERMSAALALSLIADVLTRGARVGSCRLDNEPEVVRLLLEKFVQDVPSRDHRLALHLCVTVWATTEPLLAAALGRSDAHDLFEWLEHLPFVEYGPYGLFPHDLARDVVYADFRWRDPEASYSLLERTISHLYGRLERTSGLDRQRLWFDLLYIQRYNARCGRIFSGPVSAPSTPTPRSRAITRLFSRWSSVMKGRRPRRSPVTG